MAENKIKINKLSERYRVCPECATEFMTDHLLRKFCSDKCHDDYHNRIKRLSKKEVIIQEEQKVLQEQEKESESERKAKLEHNIKILNTLPSNKKGIPYRITDLIKAGFYFPAYEARFPLDETNDYHWLEYGPYQVYLLEIDRILLTLKN